MVCCLFVISAFSQTFTLGVVPQQSPFKLSKKWTQITHYLSETTGYEIDFKTESSIPQFEKQLYAGQYDFAYMNPYHYVIAHDKESYEAVVRANKNIVGILLSKDAYFKISKENLAGKTLLFPAPNAFAATLLPKHELKDKFQFDMDKEAKVMYVNSHDSVYKGLERDIGDLGGGIVRTFNNYKQNDLNKLHIIYKTKAYPSHPIAFHPRVPKEVQEKIKEALLKMPKELKSILSINEFIETNNIEYNEIKTFLK